MPSAVCFFKSCLSNTKKKSNPINSLINIVLTGSVLMYICFIKNSKYLGHKGKKNKAQQDHSLKFCESPSEDLIIHKQFINNLISAKAGVSLAMHILLDQVKAVNNSLSIFQHVELPKINTLVLNTNLSLARSFAVSFLLQAQC